MAVRDALHVLHATEIGLELGEVRLGGHAFAGGKQLELPIGLEALEVVQAPDALGDRPGSSSADHPASGG